MGGQVSGRLVVCLLTIRSGCHSCESTEGDDQEGGEAYLRYELEQRVTTGLTHVDADALNVHVNEAGHGRLVHVYDCSIPSLLLLTFANSDADRLPAAVLGGGGMGAESHDRQGDGRQAEAGS